MSSQKTVPALATALLVALSGCSFIDDFGRFSVAPEGTDAGPDDGHRDGGEGAPDSSVDASVDDAGMNDAGSDDSGAGDAGPDDAGSDDSGASDAGTDDAGADDAGTGDAGPPVCPETHTCVPPTPDDWHGPVAVFDGSSACPAEYSTSELVVHRGLTAPPAQCNCGCVVQNPECLLLIKPEDWDDDTVWHPQWQCQSPPGENACLWAWATASCLVTSTPFIPPATWSVTAQICGGGAEDGECEAGRCLPRSDRLCIHRSGEHACPSGFSERTVYYRGLQESRKCSPCTCTARSQACSMEIEICSVGHDVLTLTSGFGGDDVCLNTSDGDGVTILNTTITDHGTCTTAGGVPEGSVVPTMPTTVCCMP